MIEEWRPIRGYEGIYDVSNCGRVRSLSRVVNNGSPHGRKLPDKILLPGKLKDGYLGVSLNRDGTCKYFKIHRLVAQAFIPNTDNKPYVNHKDGVKTNNVASNLEWCTQAENMRHAYNNGMIKPSYYYLTQQDRLKNAAKRAHPVLWVETGQSFGSGYICSACTGIHVDRIYNSINEKRTILGTTFVWSNLPYFDCIISKEQYQRAPGCELQMNLSQMLSQLVWMNDGKSNFRVPCKEVQTSIANGLRRGRLPFHRKHDHSNGR